MLHKNSSREPILQRFGITAEELKAQIERIKKSKPFSAAKQRQTFLDILAQHAISPGSKGLSQLEIAAALGIKNFDQTKPTVRIAAGRVRSSLTEFYSKQGKYDLIVVEFPPGPPYRLDAERRTRDFPARADKASQKYFHGRMLWAQRTPESLDHALRCFEEAIKTDATYADPHTALAQCYLFMALAGAPPRSVMGKAKHHARKAVQIAPFNAEGYASLGAILSAYEWNWCKAWHAFDRALELDDKCVSAYCFRASHLLSLGNVEAAKKDAHLILKLTSASPSALVNSHVAKVLYAAREFDEAKELLLRIKEMAPAFHLIYWQLGLVYASQCRYSAAHKCLDTARTLEPKSPAVIGTVGWAKAKAGDLKAAEAILEELMTLRKTTYIAATDIAMIYGALGKMEPAFVWLERACRERCIFMSWFKTWPPFEIFANDCRSKALLQKLKLDHPSLRTS